MTASKRLNCEKLEFGLRKSFDLLWDEKAASLIRAREAARIELVTAFLSGFGGSAAVLALDDLAMHVNYCPLLEVTGICG